MPKIIPLTTLPELLEIFPLIKQLNPKMTKKQFTLYLKEMLPEGYKAIGIKEGGRWVAVSGYWVGTRLWCGKRLEPDNVVVDKNCRGKGYGKALMDWLAKEAKRQGAEVITLESYTRSFPAHRFYIGQGFDILGYVFVKGYKG